MYAEPLGPNEILQAWGHVSARPVGSCKWSLPVVISPCPVGPARWRPSNQVRSEEAALRGDRQVPLETGGALFSALAGCAPEALAASWNPRMGSRTRT